MKYLWGVVGAFIIISLVAAFQFQGSSQAPSSPIPSSTPFFSPSPSPSPSQNSSSPTSLQKSLKTLPTPKTTFNPSPTHTNSQTPTSSQNDPKSEIISLFNQQNYSALTSYLADSVSVTIYGSECCGVMSKQEVSSQLSYLQLASPPWDFSDSNPISKTLQSKRQDLFSDTLLGTSANYYAVGIGFGGDNKISKVVFVSDYRLITQ